MLSSNYIRDVRVSIRTDTYIYFFFIKRKKKIKTK